MMNDPGRGWVVTDDGCGVAVVLVHGLGTDASAWDRVAPRLAQSHRVLTVELPGYSLNSTVDRVPHAAELADGLDAVLAEREIDEAVLVGHSFGGAVCLLTANRHPERCAGMVLIAPGGFGSELNPLLPLLGTRLGPPLLRTLYGRRASRAIASVANRVQGRPQLDSRVRIAELMETYERLRAESARARFRSCVQQSIALNSPAARAQFADIDPRIPIRIIWGREDRVLPVWQASAAAELLPGAVVHVMDGVGHTPHRSHPVDTVREIRSFISSAGVQRRFSPAGS
jgi:pimeloyl-ACP methyl ester carboxylesterase